MKTEGYLLHPVRKRIIKQVGFVNLYSVFHVERREKTVLFDARTEGELQYLESEEAYFTVMLKWGERLQFEHHPVVEMHERLEKYSWLRQADVYQSQHWFVGKSRMKANLKGMGTSFFDGDYYKNPEHRGKPPEEVWEEMKALMVEKGYPLPSAVIASGQGVYVKWYFSKPLRREMLAYWDTLQIKFLNLFEGFGADPEISGKVRG